VVFGGQPEDGCVRPARGRSLATAGQRGSRLEWREQRPAKQAHLLAGYHHSRAVSQSIEGRCGSWGRRSILLGQQAEQLRPVCGPLRRKVLPLLPTLVRRGRGVEPLRRCCAGAVVQKQPMQSWHDGDGITVCGQQRILLVIENLWSNPMHMKKMGFCSVKDATPGPIDARV